MLACMSARDSRDQAAGCLLGYTMPARHDPIKPGAIKQSRGVQTRNAKPIALAPMRGLLPGMKRVQISVDGKCRQLLTCGYKKSMPGNALIEEKSCARRDGLRSL